ncbi:MAG: ribosome recycling factor [Chloroflexota bacterium]|nr:ribosome recycling factor [Chloroflexota bacterium]
MTEQAIDDTIADAERRMKRSVEHFSQELATVRTGRANPAILDGISVDYYGTPTPLNQLATLATPDARLLTVQPWDRSLIGAVEREIQKSDLGLTPSNDGQVIRLPIPPMTQERRQELVKRVKRAQEDTHVAIRNVRRDALERLRQAERDKDISQDELHRAQDRLQKTTDAQIVAADQVTARKQAEVMEV